jgi:hypothetical protein
MATMGDFATYYTTNLAGWSIHTVDSEIINPEYKWVSYPPWEKEKVDKQQYANEVFNE